MLVCSYPVTWYTKSTGKRYKTGYLVVYKHQKYRILVYDGKRNVHIPIGVMKVIIDELSKHTNIRCNQRERRQLLINFKDGLDDYIKFKKFKWETSPSGKSKHYSNQYLEWMYKNHPEKMTEAEMSEYLWKKQHGRLQGKDAE